MTGAWASPRFPPPLFLSHGAPDLLLAPAPLRDFLDALAVGRPRPAVLLVVSAHWLTRVPTVDVSLRPATLHDFAGFGPELAQFRYAVPGAPAAAERLATMLVDDGRTVLRETRGLDHGAWVPLSRIFPAGEVPTFELSLQPQHGARYHFELGRALAPWLAAEGAQLVASGGATHDLASLGRRDDGVQAEFERWLVERVERGDLPALLEWESQAPAARRAHPTSEHLLPLFVALGAAAGAPGRALFRGTGWGALQLTAFEFGGGAVALPPAPGQSANSRSI